MGLILRRMSPGDFGQTLAVALIALLLLLLLRERRRVVRVPYLQILEEALGRALPKTLGGWWRRAFSFLLQAVILLLALLAWSDPTWDGSVALRQEPVRPEPPPRLVLVLDRSRSMEALRPKRKGAPLRPKRKGAPLRPKREGALSSTVFDLARTRAASWIRSLPSDTRVLLATLDGRVRLHALWVEPDRALEALSTLHTVDRPDRPEVLGKWIAELRTENPEVPIRVLTDLQRREAWRSVEGDGITISGYGAPAGNLRIDDLRARADPGSPGRARVLCRIRYAAAGDAPQVVEARLEISGRALDGDALQVVLDVRSLRLTSGVPQVVRLDLDDLPGPLLRARLVAGAPGHDVLSPDSARWADVPTLRPVRVAVVGQSSPELLAALVSDPFIDLLPPAGPDADPPANAQVLVWAKRLPGRLDRPALILDPPLRPDHPLGAVATVGPGALEVVRHRFWRDLDPGDLTLAHAGALSPNRGERSILRLGDAVVATAGRHDGHPIVRIGLPMDDPAVTRRVAFPAMLARAIDLLQDRVDLLGMTYEVGRVPLDSVPDDPVIQVLDARGRPVPVAGLGSARSFWTDRADLYLARHASGRVDVRIVVPEPDRSEDLLVGVEHAGDLRGPAPRAPVERSRLWWGLLVGILALLLIDRWLFVARRVV